MGGWVGQLGWVGGLASPEAAPKCPPPLPPPVDKQTSVWDTGDGVSGVGCSVFVSGFGVVLCHWYKTVVVGRCVCCLSKEVQHQVRGMGHTLGHTVCARL